MPRHDAGSQHLQGFRDAPLRLLFREPQHSCQSAPTPALTLPRAKQFGHNDRTNKTGCPGDKNTHDRLLFVGLKQDSIGL
jgi:hypothetical protein